MSLRILRACLKVILASALAVWVIAAPFVWLLQDGLGPDSVESGWGRALWKFAAGWGVPAIVLAVPLIGLWLVDRRPAVSAE